MTEPDPLRVVLNLVPIERGGGGIARYAIELVAALARRDDVVVHAVVGLDAPDELLGHDSVSIVRVPVRSAGLPLHLLAQFGVAPLLALLRRADVLHSPANAGPVRIPGVPSVITMHDTIWLHAPDDWGTPAAVRSMHRVAVPTARRATRVLTDSHAAARDLEVLLGIEPDRIDVAHLGVSVAADRPGVPAAELREALGIGPGPIVACIAQKRPYKGQDVLVRALADERLSCVQLVLPGASTPYEDTLRATADELGVRERVTFPAWIGDDQLEGLYRVAHCVALPSRLEGFGLPVLEAMARGVPVACSDRSALPEVAGDAALLFDPDDPTAVADALARLVGDPELRADLGERGRARASAFTWEATAQATVACYRRALSRP